MSEEKDSTLLSETEEALLDLLLAEEGLEGEGATTIPPRPADDPVPLTAAQSRIWFFEKLEPGRDTFLISTAIRLRMAIEVDPLIAAFDRVWHRHEALRTAFYVADGQVWQQPAYTEPPQLDVVDLSHLEIDARGPAVEHLLDAARHTPFALEKEPLLWVQLVRLQADDYLFLLTIHHLIADGWSVNLLLRELVQSYLAALAGDEPRLPPLSIQYADYARWQQEQLEEERLQRQLAYWRRQLQGPLPTTELPRDFARTTDQSFASAQQQLILPADLYQDLTALARESGATLYMTLLAAFQLLLWRHTGEGEVILGSPVSGRNLPLLENLVGLFVNMVVLRTDLSSGATFRELLAQVREVALEAFANQEIPFEKLLQEMLPSRDPTRTPFFQNFFNMLRFDQPLPDLGSQASFLSHPELDTTFDLTLYVEEVGDGMQLTLVYNRMLYRQERMVDLLRQYQKVLEQVTENPDRPLATLSLLTAPARAILPDPTKPLPQNWPGPIFARLDMWAATQPQALAVAGPESSWHYGELAANSNRLAHFLVDGGVQSGDRVIIYGHRCAALVGAIMGVLKAGGIVTILDAQHPPTLLQRIIRAADPVAWLAFAGAEPPAAIQETLAEVAGATHMLLPVTPEATAACLELFPDHPPAIAVEADTPAVLSFTSGSTGEPKGVLGRHGSLTHFYPWMADRFGFDRDDRFSMLSGLAHDPLQRDIFTALWVGAQIHVPDPQEIGRPGYLARWLERADVTVAHLVPSMVYLLTIGGEQVVEAQVRYALFVGEPLTRSLAGRLHQLLPDATIVNLYGATETQRAVSYQLFQPGERGAGQPKQTIPLGTGMPGAQLLVLAGAQQLAGIGELGEIHMRSPHLALGYWRQPEQTADRFISNPWRQDPADRLYRTGDFGRFLPDGRVEFAGRRDNQVNIRGFRVEIGEIEAALSSHPQVTGAVVNLVEHPEEVDRLVAHLVVSSQESGLTPQTIREYARRLLPTHMVPASVLFIDEIPLLPNGKIDRKALPLPSPGQIEKQPVVKSRDEIEETLAAIWEELLKQGPLGVNQDFFELGGHSILAIRMFTRLKQTFDVDLNIGLLFQHPTIAELAAVIKKEMQGDRSAAPRIAGKVGNVVPIHRGATEQPCFFCVHGAGGNVFFMHDWKPYFAPWSLYGLESPSVDGITWDEEGWQEMATRYVDNLQAVQPHGPYLLGGYSGGGVLAYEMAQQLGARGEEVSLLVLIDAYHTSVRAEPFSTAQRIRRILAHPYAVLTHFLRRHVIAPAMLAYLKLRFVRRGRRVPLEHREILMTDYFMAAKQQYEPAPYDGPVLLIRSLENFASYSHLDQQLGWGDLLLNLTIAEVNSNHFTVVQEPHIPVVVRAIKETWKQLANRASGHRQERSPSDSRS